MITATGKHRPTQCPHCGELTRIYYVAAGLELVPARWECTATGCPGQYPNLAATAEIEQQGRPE